MSWTEAAARKRVHEHIESVGEIEVKPLAREVNDIETVLSEKECRDIVGSHVYASVTNFAEKSSDDQMESDDYKALIRSLHVYQREVSYIAETLLGAYRVHFQGPKVHVLSYVPVHDEAAAARNAALLLLILDDFVRSVFNQEFQEIDDWRIGGGGDVGNAIGTRNGMRGERELLFIGDPANQAAKIIVDRNSLRLTSYLHSLLPNDLQACCHPLKGETYKISAPQETLDELCRAYGINWKRDASRQRVQAARAALPLDEITYSGANDPIAFETLTERNSKRVLAASIFADVAGFTAYVRDAGDDDEKQKQALRLFHVVRKELRRLLGSEHAGVQVQFQGDRIQGLLNVPKGDAASIAREAVEIAIDMQSSFEQAIKHEIPEAKPLSLAIGVDLGSTLATRLGQRGDRDNICLGCSVEEAAAIEERCEGGMIGVSAQIYEHLEKEIMAWFDYDDLRKCYVARGLTWEAFEAHKKAEMYKAAGAVVLAAGVGAMAAIAISSAKSDERETVQPSKPYGP